MKRVYKVLLPLYREAEVSSELKHQWKSDANGLDTMGMTQFTKLLFKIVHSWAIHVDLEEYIEFLQVTTLILMLIPSLMLMLVGCC